jgi:hypothetical protein
MTTDWAHLPNAVHIDRVIASVKAHRNQWDEAWNTVQDARRGKARGAVRNAAWAEAWNTVQDVGRTAEYNAAWWAARWEVWDAVLALCAYDDCAYMLDSDPGELAILAAFGDPRAILLLSACKAFHSLKEIA